MTTACRTLLIIAGLALSGCSGSAPVAPAPEPQPVVLAEVTPAWPDDRNELLGRLWSVRFAAELALAEGRVDQALSSLDRADAVLEDGLARYPNLELEPLPPDLREALAAIEDLRARVERSERPSG